MWGGRCLLPCVCFPCLFLWSWAETSGPGTCSHSSTPAAHQTQSPLSSSIKPSLFVHLLPYCLLPLVVHCLATKSKFKIFWLFFFFFCLHCLVSVQNSDPAPDSCSAALCASQSPGSLPALCQLNFLDNKPCLNLPLCLHLRVIPGSVVIIVNVSWMSCICIVKKHQLLYLFAEMYN